MSKFYPISIKNIERETDDCVSISLDIHDELKDNFNYKAGQYLTFRMFFKGNDVRRSYSLCSSPLDNEWKVAVKEIKNGQFSSYANRSLKVGDILEVMPPMGNFTIKADLNTKLNIVSFASGSGITPILSFIKTVLKSNQQSTFTLFYGNKTSDSIIFKKELENLKKIYSDRLFIYYIFSREPQSEKLFTGRLSAEKSLELSKKHFDIKNTDGFFLCGPEEMIIQISQQLENLGVEKSKIHFELFTTPTEALKTLNPSATENQSNAVTTSKVTIILDDNAIEFDLDSNGESILDVALKNGADLPFACKGGVCCTCKAKVTSGTVKMDMNYGLEPDEVERGYVLTCQSHPTSPEVVVDFDAY